ncbi:MAG TPA: hypothetical protein VIK49_07375 [Steroidobacteraceae bacterium]
MTVAMAGSRRFAILAAVAAAFVLAVTYPEAGNVEDGRFLMARLRD